MVELDQEVIGLMFQGEMEVEILVEAVAVDTIITEVIEVAMAVQASSSFVILSLPEPPHLMVYPIIAVH